ncbi:MAG: cell division protein ZapA [Acidobacteriia bacterium]|nr:cell division protein ZapA [Terriglobia bacterium]
MTPPDENIAVEIYDQTYHLRGGADPEYVKQLAGSLDERMRQIADSTQTVDSLKVAVLTALTMIDELSRLQRENQEMQEILTEKTEACIKLLDSVLQQSK